jgi:ketosteroid isomerase-like protein
MSGEDDSTAALAERLRVALEGGDSPLLADLLDPDVRWGAPGDPSPPCQNRQQVLEWYRGGRAAGRVGTVTGVVATGAKILVAMTVTTEGGPATNEASRWLVLTVANGRITDIRGYDDHEDAVAAAGRPG